LAPTSSREQFSPKFNYVDFFERTIYNEEHEQFRSSFRQWVDKEVMPHHLEWEKDGITPRDIWIEAGKHGFLGYNVPEVYGGGGSDDALRHHHRCASSSDCRRRAV
jgi:alkylation response protein AidB-like acyl-CoA dehydrogenase